MPFAKIRDIKINYNVIGSGFPLILIEGLGVDSSSWIFQIPDLQKHFKLILFDNRGIGKSNIGFKKYSIKLFADDTVGLLNFLDIEKTHVLGSSMGGMIAQEIAINHPEIVDKLILCSTFAKSENIIELMTKGIRDILEDTQVDVFETNPKRIMFEKIFSYFLRQIFTDTFLITNNNMIQYTLKQYLSKITYPENFMRQIVAISKHNTLKRLNGIKSDTLIVTGNSDKLIPPSCSEILSEKIPKSKLIKVNGGSHGFHFEMSDLFNNIVINFLAGGHCNNSTNKNY